MSLRYEAGVVVPLACPCVFFSFLTGHGGPRSVGYILPRLLLLSYRFISFPLCLTVQSKGLVMEMVRGALVLMWAVVRLFLRSMMAWLLLLDHLSLA